MEPMHQCTSSWHFFMHQVINHTTTWHSSGWHSSSKEADCCMAEQTIHMLLIISHISMCTHAMLLTTNSIPCFTSFFCFSPSASWYTLQVSEEDRGRISTLDRRTRALVMLHTLMGVTITHDKLLHIWWADRRRELQVSHRNHKTLHRMHDLTWSPLKIE